MLTFLLLSGLHKHNKEMHDFYCTLYCLGDQTSKVWWEEHVERMGVKKYPHRILGGGNLEEKRVIGKPKYRWQNTIKIDLKEVGLDSTGSG